MIPGKLQIHLFLVWFLVYLIVNFCDTEMLQLLGLELLDDRRKAHRLNIFYLALNNSIALPIPDYFSPKQRFTRSFSNDSFIQANCNHDYYF